MRVIIIVDEMGCSALEEDGQAYGAVTACEALGAWAYRNREALGIDLELVTRHGSWKAPR